MILKNIINPWLLATAIACLPFNQSRGEEKSEETKLPRPYVETSFVSDLVYPSGATVSERCRQDLAVLAHKNLSLSVWQNQFKGEEGIAERDYCVSYFVPVNSNLTASFGFQYWDYPNERFGKYDSVETIGLSHEGIVNTEFGLLHLNKTDAVDNGIMGSLKASKSVRLYNGKTKVSVTPSISTAWLDNYYGSSGIAHATAGAKVSVSRRNFTASCFINSQKSLDETIESLNWGGFTAGFQF